MGSVFSPNKFSSTKRAAMLGLPSWEDIKYYYGTPQGRRESYKPITSWLQPDISTILQDPQQRQAIQNALLNALQDPKQQQVVQEMILKGLQDPQYQQVVQEMILKGLQDPQQQQALQTIILNILQDPKQQQVVQDMILKTIQDPKQREALRQQFKQETGRILGGYFTLPALLALLSSIFTDKPIVPILLGLAGLGIAHFFPEVRENVNIAKWLSALEKQEGSEAGEGTPT